MPDSLTALLTDAHVEVMPTKGIEEQIKFLAPAATVTVTCSPGMSIDVTLEMAALISGLGFNDVPHLAARQISN